MENLTKAIREGYTNPDTVKRGGFDFDYDGYSISIFKQHSTGKWFFALMVGIDYIYDRVPLPNGEELDIESSAMTILKGIEFYEKYLQYD